ncbi:SidA/IucD/PvdA family monooxygenase [Marinibacterium sp. SX1]|uniref:SidA/IucD/PvdA family monooxygenase n=1 Tax=Marinibacterium sp. SX1 TaxID=3388424 RepID=UPI003D175F3A
MPDPARQPVPPCQIIGFGPAAISFLIAADRTGLLPDLLRAGLIIHEAEPDVDALLQRGINYDIVSNSAASDFLEGIRPDGAFAEALDRPLAALLRQTGDRPVPLQLVAAFEAELRQDVLRLVRRFPQSRIRFGRRILCLRSGPNDGPVEGPGITAIDEDGTETVSRRALLACGSIPVIPDALAGAAARHGVRLIHSERFLRPAGAATLPGDAGRIVVVGGSHSAFSILHKLLEETGGDRPAIDILHRAPIRRMHLSAAAARAAGEAFDPVADVCPASGRVFRFQGLYTRSRALYEQVRAGLHARVRLVEIASDKALDQAIAGAGLVIAGTGYRPRLPRLEDAGGRPLDPGTLTANCAIDARGRLCDGQGAPFDGLMGLGLGFGRRNTGIGEPSHAGAPVGINIFQGADGEALCRHLADQTTKDQRKAG